MNAFTSTTRAILMACTLCFASAAPLSSAQTSSIAASTVPAHSVEERTLQLPSGESFNYLFITPANYTPAQAYPTLIALSAGKATRPLVDEAIRRYWVPLVEQYQFVIAAPISPFSAQNYFTENPRTTLALSDELNGTLKIKGGRQYLAGVSSGGAAAANTFLLAPGQFASLTLLPGLMDKDLTAQQLTRLSGKRITFLVGENDSAWHQANESAANTLLSAGAEAAIIPIPQQGHVLTLAPTFLHTTITGSEPVLPLPDSAVLRKPQNTNAGLDPPPHQASMGAMKPTPLSPPVIITNPIKTDPVKNLKTIDAVDDARIRAIGAVLTDFHDAASKADENRYFNHFTPDAVFIGTDAKERWTYAQFRAYAKPYFDAGKGWTYTASSRNIYLSPNADVAWFDEMLENKKYGTCRGTGVLIKIDQIWRIAQYHLVIPVPNELVDDLMKLITDSNAESK